MSNPSSDPAIIRDRVRLALRLGWTLAEIYGRLMQKPLPSTPGSSTRLFLGELKPTPDARLWAATQRLALLCEALFPASEPAAKNTQEKPAGQEQEGQPEEPRQTTARPDGNLWSRHIEYPKSIPALANRLEQRLATGRGKLPRAEALYGELDAWSREVWAALDAEDPALSEAASLGASLADTFWQWPYPGSGQESRSSSQTWQYLLNPKRINDLIRKVRPVQGYLPAYTGAMLRHSLWEWEIGNQLVRTSADELEIAHPILYRFRSMGWARSWRRTKMKGESRLFLDPTPEEEKALLDTAWKQLHQQAQTWAALIFGRPATFVLQPSDWRQTRWLAFGLYAILSILITAGVAAFLILIAGIVFHIVVVISPSLAIPKEFQDQLALVTTAVAGIAFLGTQFWRGVKWLYGLYSLPYQWVLMRKLEQRSLQRWNGGTKPLFWVWLQHLLRAEDR